MGILKKPMKRIAEEINAVKNYASVRRPVRNSKGFFRKFKSSYLGQGFKLKLVRTRYEANVGMLIFKEGQPLGLLRIKFPKENGKRIVSVEAVQGSAPEITGRRAWKDKREEFKKLAGMPWAEFLVKNLIDTAREAGYDRVRVIRAEKQYYWPVEWKKEHYPGEISEAREKRIKHAKDRRDSMRGLYDKVPPKLGITKIDGDYRVLDLK